MIDNRNRKAVSRGVLVCLIALAAPAYGATSSAVSQATNAAASGRTEAPGRLPDKHPDTQRRLAKLHGKVTDFESKPLDHAEIRVLGRGFGNDIAGAFTDEKGLYQLEVAEGTYLAVWICKDYKEKNVEYWAWHVPLYGDVELNARVNGLEVYGMDAFWPRYRPVLMVYFRPMSLKRYLGRTSGTPDQSKGIAPNLSQDDIQVSLDGKPAPVLGVNRAREQVGANQYMDAYLVQVQAEGLYDTDAYRKITVAIVDRETGEKGEGSVFWRYTLYEEGPKGSGKE